jgi:hypothetical protein
VRFAAEAAHGEIAGTGHGNLRFTIGNYYGLFFDCIGDFLLRHDHMVHKAVYFGLFG